ncbi:MAG TPA: Mut7-C RNAse domain-containing protein [Candidatus Binataceae bacterium]|jgi:hypothetical protein|nr:Mut7-C RNAse domain-containing protein [Candidatus Binataceae bacterium]
MPDSNDTAATTRKFAADRTLIRLARWLRLMGADVFCDQSLSAAATLERARAEGRSMLTRDKRLLNAADTLYIEHHLFRDQLREVLVRFPFDPHRRAFTRCSLCNNLLRHVSRDSIRRRVPPFVFAGNDHFAVCDSCDKVYWPATHLTRALREIDDLESVVP